MTSPLPIPIQIEASSMLMNVGVRTSMMHIGMEKGDKAANREKEEEVEDDAGL